MLPLVNLDHFHVERVYEGALRVLESVGLVVENPAVLQKAHKEFAVAGARVRIPRAVVSRYVDEIRQRAGTVERPPDEPADGHLVIGNTSLSFTYVDPASGEARPYDTQTLTKHTRFNCALHEDGRFIGSAPGYPMDVPGVLQFITNAYLNCVYNPRPVSPALSVSARERRYLLELCEIMGFRPLFVTELISPMKFIGGSIDIAVELAQPDDAVVTDPMPILGVTAPMDWQAAWSQSVAENLGSYVLLRLCGFEDVAATFRLFVPNLTCGMAYFSSPKHLTALLTRRKLRAFFGLRTEASEFLLVTAKRPDLQAAAEKTAGCMLAAHYGFHYLPAAGHLWMDQIYSPQQLIIDLEIRDYVESLRTTVPESRCSAVEEIRAGMEAGHFMARDLSLDHFAEFSWRPRLFDLVYRPEWDSQSILRKAGEVDVEAIAAGHTYELQGEKREELERWYSRARNGLG